MNGIRELSEKEMDFIECELMNIKNNLSGRCVGSVVSQLVELCSTIEGHKSSADFVGELQKRFIYSKKTTESTYRDLEGYENLYRNDIKEIPDFDDEVARIHRNELWNIIKKSAIVVGLFALVIAFMNGRLP